jgi:eukaryotic-like serine/threonine-protein kinase
LHPRTIDRPPEDDHMSNDVIGSRYRLGTVVTCTPEATTWDALDTWLEERVLVVTPEPGFDKRFAALAGAVLDQSSVHLVGLYDIGTTTSDFAVFGVPATLSDERVPREEEDVLVAGRALGDALEALHERGGLHGDLHPGSVVLTESGDVALSPWPLAPRPHNWSGPGGFGVGPHEPRAVSARDDVRALGAVLLEALAGPPVLSSEQVENLKRELAGRAPDAVTIADRALTSPARGGYALAAELRDDCAAALAGRSVATSVSDLPPAADNAAVATRSSETTEGRRAAMVLATSGVALLAGFGVAGSLGAASPRAVHKVAAHASGCVLRPAPPHCAGGDRADAHAAASQRAAGVPVRLADHSVSAAPAPSAGAAAHVSTSTPATSATAARPPAPTTTEPPSTTTSSDPSTSTTTSTTTTEAAPTTTTTTPPSTTTSTSATGMQAGPSLGAGSWLGQSPGGAPGTGPGH